jgi:hypothetical protein
MRGETGRAKTGWRCCTIVPSSYYRIDLQQIPKRFAMEPLVRVRSDSPLHLKRAVKRLADYFHREFPHDIHPFDVEDRDPYTSYLLPCPERSVWAGACCFRPRRFSDLDMTCEVLYWAWLHPYLRGCGILKRHWKALRANHGDFYIEQPFSPAMREFLRKHNTDSVWYPLFEGKKPDAALIRTKLTANRAKAVTT